MKNALSIWSGTVFERSSCGQQTKAHKNYGIFLLCCVYEYHRFCTTQSPYFIHLCAGTMISTSRNAVVERAGHPSQATYRGRIVLLADAKQYIRQKFYKVDEASLLETTRLGIELDLNK